MVEPTERKRPGGCRGSRDGTRQNQIGPRGIVQGKVNEVAFPNHGIILQTTEKSLEIWHLQADRVTTPAVRLLDQVKGEPSPCFADDQRPAIGPRFVAAKSQAFVAETGRDQIGNADINTVEYGMVHVGIVEPNTSKVRGQGSNLLIEFQTVGEEAKPEIARAIDVFSLAHDKDQVLEERIVAAPASEDIGKAITDTAIE